MSTPLRDINDPSWWRPWQVERALHLDEIGVDTDAIAERLSKTRDQVILKLRRLRGARFTRMKRMPETIVAFNTSEDRQLLALLALGKSYREIAQLMGRTRNSVAGRAHRLREALKYR